MGSSWCASSGNSSRSGELSTPGGLGASWTPIAKRPDSYSNQGAVKLAVGYVMQGKPSPRESYSIQDCAFANQLLLKSNRLPGPLGLTVTTHIPWVNPRAAYNPHARCFKIGWWRIWKIILPDMFDDLHLDERMCWRDCLGDSEISLEMSVRWGMRLPTVWHFEWLEKS